MPQTPRRARRDWRRDAHVAQFVVEHGEPVDDAFESLMDRDNVSFVRWPFAPAVVPVQTPRQGADLGFERSQRVGVGGRIRRLIHPVGELLDKRRHLALTRLGARPLVAAQRERGLHALEPLGYFVELGMAIGLRQHAPSLEPADGSSSRSIL